MVTSGGGDEAQVAYYMNHFMITTGITPVGSVWATMGVLVDEQFTDEILDNAHALGHKLVHDWQNRVSTPEIDAQKAQFKERMRQLIRYRADEWPFENEYWQKKHQL